MADATTVVTFDEPLAAVRVGAQRRLSALIDGETVPGPIVSTSLELRQGGRRHVLMLERGAAGLEGRRLTLAIGSEISALIDPDWLQSPLADVTALTDGLSDAGRKRLLRLFLTTGASLFGYGQAGVFAPAVEHLLEMIGVVPAEFAACCPIGETAQILSFRLPPSGIGAAIGDLIALLPDRITRVAGFSHFEEAGAEERLLHIYLPVIAGPGAKLIGMGDKLVHLCTPTDGPVPQPLVPWLSHRPDSTRRWVLDLLVRRAAGDASAATLLREVRHGTDDPPHLTLVTLAQTPDGVLLNAVVSDPHDLVRAMRVERGAAGTEIPLPASPLRTGAAVSLADFLALPDPGLGEPCRIRLMYRSGRAQTVHTGEAAPFDGAIPAGFGISNAAALARATLSMPRRSFAARSNVIGTPPERPRLSIVITGSGSPDLIRAGAAALCREPGAAAVELIYHVSDGPEATGLHRALAATHAIYGLPSRMLTHPAQANPAERLCNALASIRGDGALVLGADVLPARSGWLATWLRVLGDQATRPVVGATLLRADGSVLDAGGSVSFGSSGEVPRLTSRFRGLPGCDLPCASSMATGLATADCVGLTRRAIAVLLAFTGRYPNPDMLIAATIQRLSREGPAARTLLRNRFVRYREVPPPDSLARAVDAHALGLVLDGAFGPASVAED